MRFTVPKPLNTTAEFLIRRAGYGKIVDRARGEVSYVYRLSRTAFYPRFHCYIEKDEAASFVVNIHLDQKQPSYEGSHMHSGEYEGEGVEKEARRIKEAIARAQLQDS
jgi:hypothetical protein